MSKRRNGVKNLFRMQFGVLHLLLILEYFFVFRIKMSVNPPNLESGGSGSASASGRASGSGSASASASASGRGSGQLSNSEVIDVDDEQQPGTAGSDSRVRFRLRENPVHQHFKYNSSDDKSTCNLCKFRLSGKNSTTLGTYY
jgi:hypothetical protein